MKPLVDQWIEKAEEDYLIAQKFYRARKYFNYDYVCFYSEQSAEKYIKAFMVKKNLPFSKYSYNLPKLLKTILPFDPGWIEFRDDMKVLKPYGRHI